MTKRLVDINGHIINAPEHYHTALQYGRQMVEKLDENGIDRSDIHVIVDRLTEEIKFTLLMLKDR